MVSRRKLGSVAAAAALVAVASAPAAGTAAASTESSGWRQVSLPTAGHTIYGLRHVAFTDAQHGWIVGSLNMGVNKPVRTALWFTSDAGHSWLLRWTPTAQSPGTATFADATHGWYAEHAGRSVKIFRTADAGRAWTLQATLPGDVVSMSAVDRTHAWLSGNRGFLAATTDGRTWQRLGSPTSNFAQSLQFVNRADGWVVDGTGRLHTTGDGGATWTRLGRIGRDPFAQVDFVNLDRGWASAYRGLYRSTNGGRSWTRQVTTSPGKLGAIHFSDRTHGWIVDGTSTLHTSNGGRTWTGDASPGAYLSSITSTPAGDEWTVGLAAYLYPHGA